MSSASVEQHLCLPMHLQHHDALEQPLFLEVIDAPLISGMSALCGTCAVSLYKSYGQESCIKKGALKVAQLKSVIQIYQRPTLVAMVTKIWEF